MALEVKIIEVNAANLSERQGVICFINPEKTRLITVSVPFTGGKCSLEAEIKHNGQQISSIREFKVTY